VNQLIIARCETAGLSFRLSISATVAAPGNGNIVRSDLFDVIIDSSLSRCIRKANYTYSKLFSKRRLENAGDSVFTTGAGATVAQIALILFHYPGLVTLFLLF
jgi:hypothetical protein